MTILISIKIGHERGRTYDEDSGQKRRGVSKYNYHRDDFLRMIKGTLRCLLIFTFCRSDWELTSVLTGI